MNFTKLKLGQFFSIIALMLFCQTTVFAQPVMIPGFMGIESSYIEAPASDEDSTNAYFTIVNLHYEPLRLLSASSEIFENAVFLDANNQQLEFVEILPGQRIAMIPGGLHMQLNDIDSGIAAGDSFEFKLKVRRGREALPFQEEMVAVGLFSGGPSPRPAGIPNEDEYAVKVPVKH
mgnify:FL=1